MGVSIWEGGKAERLATALETVAEGIGSIISPEAVAETVATNVTAWLDENVESGETLVVDNSLTIQGAAADAKKTGYELSEVKSAVNHSPRLFDSDSASDLDIADENGNVLARFADGEIETNYFHSRDVRGAVVEIEASGNADLNLSDNGGNVIARFSDGAIETKGFRGFRYKKFESEKVTYVGNSVTLSINQHFLAGDRIVVRVERGQYPWDYGAVVSYYEGEKEFMHLWRGDSAWLEHIVSTDVDQVSVVYPANSAGLPQGSILQLTVYLLGDIPITPKVITVKSDGTGDYSTLRGALDAVGYQANDVLNPYRIEIYPGIYNVLADYTDEEINAADIGGGYNQISFVGPKLLNGVSLIGMGTTEEIVLMASLDPDDYTSEVRGNISTLNLQGTCSIENLTVIGENIRYCVHDDFYSVIGKPKRRLVKNCVFRGYNVSGYHPNTTYGAGCFESGGYYEFIDCDFGENAGLHTTARLYNTAYVHLTNCVGHGFRIGDNATANLIDASSTFVFDNTNFQYIHQNMADSVPHVVVRGTVKDVFYQFDPNTLYATADVQVVPNVELQFTGGVGTVVQRQANGAHGPRFVPLADLAMACGVVVYQDTEITCVQTSGYIRTDRTSITSFALGDLVGVVNSSLAVVSSESDSIGSIAYIDNAGAGYIKLKWRY